MSKIRWFFCLLGFVAAEAFSQDSAPYKTELVVDSTSVKLYGTLLVPSKKAPVILFIAGSGPTDRDGNNSWMTNNSTKRLAEELTAKGIATLRYDKRGIAQSKQADLKEEDMVFETMIEDAQRWIRWLKKDKRFTHVIIAGHSEGSLVGMVAGSREKINGFISLAGAGRPIDVIIKEQVAKNPNNPPQVIHEVDTIFTQLRDGKKVEDVPFYLLSLFRPSVQPYMISWLKYDPAKEIQKLKVPVLIVQGTTDIQVSMTDSQLLKNARPKAQYALISGMNHIFKNAPADNVTENIATYNKPELPLSEPLVPTILNFITKIK